MASCDDSKNVVTIVLNEENCEVNEAPTTSNEMDAGNSEMDTNISPSGDLENVASNESVHIKETETKAILSSTVTVEGQCENDLKTSEDSQNNASAELKVTNNEADVGASQSSQSENETSREVHPANSSRPVSRQQQEDADRIEVIPDEEAGGDGPSPPPGEEPDQGVPGCVYCQRERTQRLEVEEPDAEDGTNNYQKLCKYMEEFVNSWKMVGILAALMIWAYSVVYTGYSNKGKCIFMGNIINLFTLVGATGFAASGTRIIVMVVQKLFKKNHFCIFLLVAAETFSFVWAYSVLLGFFVYNGDSPTGEPGEPAYCDLTFYNFMIISTWVMLVVLVVLAFLYISAYSTRLFRSSGVNVVSSSRYGAVNSPE